MYVSDTVNVISLVAELKLAAASYRMKAKYRNELDKTENIEHRYKPYGDGGKNEGECWGMGIVECKQWPPPNVL